MFVNYSQLLPKNTHFIEEFPFLPKSRKNFFFYVPQDTFFFAFRLPVISMAGMVGRSDYDTQVLTAQL